MIRQGGEGAKSAALSPSVVGSARSAADRSRLLAKAKAEREVRGMEGKLGGKAGAEVDLIWVDITTTLRPSCRHSGEKAAIPKTVVNSGRGQTRRVTVANQL